MAQAYREDKATAFMVEDSAVLSALPTAVARFAVGSGIAWQMAALAVVRDGALFMTLYLLCVAVLVGGEDDVNLEQLAMIACLIVGRAHSAGMAGKKWTGEYPSTLIVHTRIPTRSKRALNKGKQKPSVNLGPQKPLSLVVFWSTSLTHLHASSPVSSQPNPTCSPGEPVVQLCLTA